MAIFDWMKSIFSKSTKKKSAPLDEKRVNQDSLEEMNFDEEDIDSNADEDVKVKESNLSSSKQSNEKKTSSNKSNFKGKVRDERNEEFDWFSDRYQSLIIQRNIAIFLLVISVLCVTFTGISLAVITNSKTIEPFVIEIEKKQGLVTYVDNNNRIRDYSQDEMVRNYFVNQYISARETFDTKNYDYFYHKVVKGMSDDKVYRQFISILRSSGRENPVNLLANNETSKVTITSITALKPKVLQVRFVVEGRFNDGSTVKSPRVAILEYDFFNIEMEESKRYINPLGFIVTSYRATDEKIQ